MKKLHVFYISFFLLFTGIFSISAQRQQNLLILNDAHYMDIPKEDSLNAIGLELYYALLEKKCPIYTSAHLLTFVSRYNKSDGTSILDNFKFFTKNDRIKEHPTEDRWNYFILIIPETLINENTINDYNLDKLQQLSFEEILKNLYGKASLPSFEMIQDWLRANACSLKNHISHQVQAGLSDILSRSKEIAWNIAISGHGSTTGASYRDEFIANLRRTSFSSLLDFLEKEIAVNLFYFSSCFAGGRTREKAFHNQQYSFPIVCVSSNDEETTVAYYYGMLFEDINKIMISSENATQIFLACSKLTPTNIPSIRWPQKAYFTPLEGTFIYKENTILTCNITNLAAVPFDTSIYVRIFFNRQIIEKASFPLSTFFITSAMTTSCSNTHYAFEIKVPWSTPKELLSKFKNPWYEVDRPQNYIFKKVILFSSPCSFITLPSKIIDNVFITSEDKTMIIYWEDSEHCYKQSEHDENPTTLSAEETIEYRTKILKKSQQIFSEQKQEPGTASIEFSPLLGLKLTKEKDFSKVELL